MRAVSAASPLFPTGNDPAPSRTTTLSVVTAARLGKTISVTPFLSVLTAGVGNCTAGCSPGLGGLTRNASGSGRGVGARLALSGGLAAGGGAAGEAQAPLSKVESSQKHVARFVVGFIAPPAPSRARGLAR